MTWCFRLCACLALLLPAAALAQDKPIFRVSYDYSFMADEAAGKADVTTFEEVSFEMLEKYLKKGVRGRAVLTGVSGEEEELMPIHFLYDAKGNIDVKSGSVAFWVKPVDWAGSDRKFHIFFEARGPKSWLLIYKFYKSSELFFLYGVPGARQDWVVAKTNISNWDPGVWQHVVGTWDSAKIVLYVNGLPKDMKNIKVLPTSEFTKIAVGGIRPHEWKPTKGTSLIDELAIYPKPLSREAIHKLWLSQRPNDLSKIEIGVGKSKVTSRQSRDYGEGFVEHGVAAPVARAMGIVATVGKNKRPVILTLIPGIPGPYMLVIDAITGCTQQIALPKTRSRYLIFAFLLSSQNKLYLHSDYLLMEFDPKLNKFTFVGTSSDRTAMSITECHNGIIWTASYPNSHLTAFNPKNRKLTNYGQINHEFWRQYPRSIAVDRAGWVYLGIGKARSHIVAFNPKTREIVPITKEDERRSVSRGYVYLSTDGNVYGHSYWKGQWYELFEGKATPLPDAPRNKRPVPAAPIKTGTQEAVFKDFPDGRVIQQISVPGKWVDIKQPKTGKIERLTFEYETEGAQIRSLGLVGPDGKIYGSTGHPLHIFRYDPVKNVFTNNKLLGHNGHWAAFAMQRNHIFGGQYGPGILWGYDPAKPWTDKAKTNPNPRRIIVSTRPHVNRPHELLAHPDGRHLVLTGTPDFGMTGGGMYIHDLDTGKSQLLTHKDLIVNQAIKTLEALPDGNLVGGTTIAPGTGGIIKVEEAELFIFDFKTRKIVWNSVILPGVSEIRDLQLGPDGLIYGLASGPIFFVFDPKARKLVHQEELSAYGRLVGGRASRLLLVGPDKNIYAIFQNAIVRIEPGSFKHTKLAAPPVVPLTGIVLHKGRLYFGHRSRLWSYRVPGL